MSFLVRSVETDDYPDLCHLAEQTSLFHLPPNKEYIKKLIRKSIESFGDRNPPNDAVYLFVLEDIKKKKVIGTSQIIACYASKKKPYYYGKTNRISRHWPQR